MIAEAVAPFHESVKEEIIMSTFRALLVGAGAMGRGWGRTLRDTPDVTLAGWVDTRPGIAAEAAAEVGLTPAYLGPDLDAAIAESHPDFVLDVTPPEAHREITERA